MVQLGYPLGTLSAVGVFAVLSSTSEADFLGWAWRIPFLISIFLAGAGLYIRLQLQETPVFRELQAENKVARLPLVEVLTKEPRAFFTAIGLKLSEISYAMIAGVFAINYVTVRLGMPKSVILNAVFVSSVVALLAIPLFGWISDQIGRKAMFYAGSLFAMAFSFPFFWLLNTRDPLIITLTIVAAITFGQISASPPALPGTPSFSRPGCATPARRSASRSAPPSAGASRHLPPRLSCHGRTAPRGRSRCT